MQRFDSAAVLDSSEGSEVLSMNPILQYDIFSGSDNDGHDNAESNSHFAIRSMCAGVHTTLEAMLADLASQAQTVLPYFGDGPYASFPDTLSSTGQGTATVLHCVPGDWFTTKRTE